MFQLFLNELSVNKPQELKLIILDNGAFHKAQRLQTPDNIRLIFLRPYSPELNPAELVWKYIKSFITNIAFPSLQQLSDNLMHIIQSHLNVSKIKSIAGFNFYLNLLDYL